jgi:cysteine desulfurase / selenocysteine lyase
VPMIDVDAVRHDTPGCEDRIHFDNAGAALMPRVVIDTVVEHLELEGRIGGYQAADAKSDRIEAVRASAARLINAKPSEIALLENATRAWDNVFYAFEFVPGDRILVGRSEYSSNYLACLQIARETGAEIVVIGDDEAGQIDVDELRRTIDGRVKLISLAHVPTGGGLVNPAAEVGRVAREAGIPLLLDATQSVGQLAIDVEEIGCDFLSTTGRKFVRGPRGTGFLYVRSERLEGMHPPMVDTRAATWVSRDAYRLRDDARRFETWEVSYALQLGLGRAIDYALAIGIDAIESRVTSLAESLRSTLSEIPRVGVHDAGRRRCGIVTFSIADRPAAEVVASLEASAANTHVAGMQDSRLDFEHRGLPDLVRASVHYYNTDGEIGRFGELVRGLAGHA